VATILIAVIIWYLPPPAGVAVKAWHLLAIFAATISGLILQPLPMGAVVIIGTMATALTGTLSPAEALNGFSNTTVWLIFAAFLFARGSSRPAWDGGSPTGSSGPLAAGLWG
jgi:DASS family divalent anion:Na+ symporter